MQKDRCHTGLVFMYYLYSIAETSECVSSYF